MAMREWMAAIKALGDENRVRILSALQGRELCVCQIVELLELAQSTVSKHLSILHQARLIESRKDGRWIFYRAAGEEAPRAAGEIASVVCRWFATSPRAAADRKRLVAILAMDRDALCKKQSRCRG
jgi:ArsR family transcriptional regulator